MTGLTPATTYHVRAYATNTAGTSYGSDVSFITAPSTTIPTLSTSEITNIQGNSAYGGGNVSDNGGTAITKRGICWSTTPSPTTDDVCISQTPSGSGEGQFFTPITRLETSTTYYVRAYATNGNGTGYGEERSFKTDLYFFIRALPAINQGFNQLSDR
jgi:pectinesterase